MKVGICTLGCKVNLYESEYIISLLKDNNYEISDFNDICDIYIINTCTVTNNSDLKSRKMINHAKKLNQNACILVCGCYVESTNNKNDIDADIVIGNYNKSKIIELLDEYFLNKKKISNIPDIMNINFEDMEIKAFNDRTRAFVKIQDGCENFCSYCIIPYVRGKCRSKDKDKVLNEINTLINNNYKEIVLTGIHTGNYGKDLNTSFSSLLEEILKIDNLNRLRISSIEITELDELFFKLLTNDKICNHLHIPLQSGSDKILKTMNRKYDLDYYKKIINKIRDIRPNISITTDIILGFPDESDKDFNDTLDFIKEIGFSKIHVFPYSKRNGTVASHMSNQIDKLKKKERVKELINLSNSLENNYKNKFINKELDVLIEKNDNGYSYGHTSNYIYLKIKDNLDVNEIYKIVITNDMLI